MKDRKLSNRLLAGFLAFVMVLGLIPLGVLPVTEVLAAPTVEYNATVTPEGAATVTMESQGNTCTVNVTLTEGYAFKNIQVSSTDKKGVETVYELTQGDGYTWTFTPGNGNAVYDVTVTCEPIPGTGTQYPVTIDESIIYGSIESRVDESKVESAAEGATVTLIPTAVSGYYLSAITVTDGSDVKQDLQEHADGTYTFTMPGSAVNVTAVFSEIVAYYTVSSNVQDGGTVTAYPEQAAENTVVTITATPEEDYALTALSVISESGHPVGLTHIGASTEDHRYTFLMPDENVTVNAYFATDDVESGLHLNKTAVLQADGTWTITLEAYATGNVTVESVTQVTPTDVILILDQSGSMTSEYMRLADSYSKVTGITNKQLASGGYYSYDSNDDAYYQIKAEKFITVHNTYWSYQRGEGKNPYDDATSTGENDTYKLLESAASGKISDTMTVGYRTLALDHAGYLTDNYVIYQRSSSGFGTSRRYSYTQVDGTYTIDLPTISNSNNTTTLYNNAVSAFTTGDYAGYHFVVDEVTSGQNTYLVVYTPATLVDDDEYHYIYTYEDAMGQTWPIGESQPDTGEEIDLDNMAANVSGDIYRYVSGSNAQRLVGLKNAANQFLNKMHAAAVAHQVAHTVSVVGFASTAEGSSETDGSSNHYENTELFIGNTTNQTCTTYNYMVNGESSDVNSGAYYTNGTLNSDAYRAAMTAINTQAGYQTLQAAINKLDGSGATFPSNGFEMARKIADIHKAEYVAGTRKLVVVFMTDGTPGRYSGSISTNQITQTTALAQTLQTEYKANVQTVALLSSKPSNQIATFLNDTDSDDYTYASDGVSLTDFFKSIEIGTDINYETISLTTNAYLVDRVSEYFDMPTDGLTQNATTEEIAQWFDNHVTISLAAHVGDHVFAEAEAVEYHKDPNAEAYECEEFIHAWPTWSTVDNKIHGITTHSFDFTSPTNMVHSYSIAYVDGNDNGVYDAPTGYTDINENGICDTQEELDTAENGNDGLVYLQGTQVYILGKVGENDVIYDHIDMGNKIVITISGVTAKDSAATGHYVYTNNEHSGLWDINENTNVYGKIASFPMPMAMIVERTYVLDYAKEAMLNTDSDIRSAISLDGVDDGVFSSFATDDEAGYTYVKSVTTTDEKSELRYGNASIKKVGDKGKLYYDPQTTNWDDYDTFYVFWENVAASDTSVGDPVTGYGWSKVNVIPANNVYFEDSFVSTEINGEAVTDTGDGKVGIVFSDEWEVKFDGDQDEAPEDYTENVENPEVLEDGEGKGTHGWTDDLADDDGYSDGSAHVTSTPTATAKFTFTGTGMDIYSRTNSNTGTILVKVADTNTSSTTETVTKVEEKTENGEIVVTTSEYQVERKKINTMRFVVDTLAKSGDYFQVPTISYSAPDRNIVTTLTKMTIVTYTIDEEGSRTESTRVEVTKDNAAENNIDAAQFESVTTTEPGYGTFNVTLTVTSGAEAEGRLTYCLDGIRIYNPLGLEGENDPVVDKAYGDKELKAVFTEVRDIILLNGDFDLQEYAVSFYAPEAAGWIEDPEVTDTVNGGQVVMPAKDVTREGYDFAGWFTEDGKQVTELTNVNAHTDVKARWVKQYTVSFDAGEGVENPANRTTYMAMLDTLPVVEREGYDFAGWFDGETEVTAETEYTDDVQLTAKWIKKVSITLDPNEGSFAEGVSNTVETVNGKLDFAALPEPTMDGFFFMGWFTSTEAMERIRPNTQFTENSTIYAVWADVEFSEEVTVTFDANGGKLDGDADTMTTVYGNLLTLPTASRDGFEFLGWFDAAADGNQVNEAETLFTTNSTVYAHWKDVSGATADNTDIVNTEVAKPGAVFIDWIKNEQSPDESEEGIHTQTTYVVGEPGVFEKYGPKNEVYLEAGQSVVFKVDKDAGNSYYVGLKSLDGKAITAEISGQGKDENGNDTDKVSVSFSHTTDMYYEIIPSANGFITIKNASDAEDGTILAITKLRTTNPTTQATDGGIVKITEPEATGYALMFSRMRAISYNASVEDPDASVDEEITEPNEPQKPEIPEVEIQNPEPEDKEPEDTENSDDAGSSLAQQLIAQLLAMINKLMNSMRSWLND